MKNTKLQICDTVIHPGEKVNLAMPLPQRYSCSPQFMPIKVIHGKQQGPVLLVIAVLKGNELNGLEIVNRIANNLDPKHMSGTVIAVPALNVYRLAYPSSTSLGGNSLADFFPGNEDGNFSERIAYLFTEEILKKSNYCIELQTGGLNHNILPQVYCNFDNREATRLAKMFQSPVVTNVNLEGNKLRQTTEELQIPLLVYQAGEAMRFDEEAINLGYNGVLNIIRAIDILPKEAKEEISPIFSQDEEWITSHTSGILHTNVTLGQMINKNELIGKITDPFGAEFEEQVKSPTEGVVVGINTTPLIHEGSPIFKVASFLDYDRAENTIEQWNKSQIAAADSHEQ